MRRLHRRIRQSRRRRPHRPRSGQTKRRASRRHRSPTRRYPTSQPTSRSPPRRRPPRTSPPCPHLSGTQAGVCPTRADRSDPPHNLSRAGAHATSPAAARLSTCEASATARNPRRRRADYITPPLPARPERSDRAPHPGAWPHAMNGATARRSRHPDSPLRRRRRPPRAAPGHQPGRVPTRLRPLSNTAQRSP